MTRDYLAGFSAAVAALANAKSTSAQCVAEVLDDAGLGFDDLCPHLAPHDAALIKSRLEAAGALKREIAEWRSTLPPDHEVRRHV